MRVCTFINLDLTLGVGGSYQVGKISLCIKCDPQTASLEYTNLEYSVRL